MNIAEAAANRVLQGRVESLERQVADLARRLDDISKAERTRETLKLKKDAA